MSSQTSSVSPTGSMDTLIQESLLSLDKKAKELAKSISWIKTQKKTEYTEDLLALQGHSSVDVRRRAIAALGDLGTQEILEQLKQWQSEESDRTAWVALEGIIDRIGRKKDGSDLGDETVLTVSEALSVVKQLIGNKTYTIEGELSEVRPVRNLYFFGLKDKVDVRINCMLVSYNISNIGFALNEGLQVRVTGQFKLSKDSRMYFDVKQIRLTGEGELLRNLMMLDQKLQLEGLYDPSRKRKPNILPQRILLLASATSAAIKDFTKVLGERRTGVEIYFLPIKTQGVGAEYEMLQRLKQANDIIRSHSIQTVVITRGGGSQDDLQLFNAESVVRAINGLPVPVVVAIGHERDVTLSEKVADVRASTPSNAAELVSWSNQQAFSQINTSIRSCLSQFSDRKHEYRNVASLLVQKIQRSFSLRVSEARRISMASDVFFQGLIYRIRSQSQSTLQHIVNQTKSSIVQASNTIPQLKLSINLQLSVIDTMNNIARQSYALITRELKSEITSTRQRLLGTYNYLRSSDPNHVLKQGFAIIKQDTTILESIKDVNRSKALTIEMQDGSVSAKADNKGK